jgi:hypothetical protein
MFKNRNNIWGVFVGEPKEGANVNRNNVGWLCVDLYLSSKEKAGNLGYVTFYGCTEARKYILRYKLFIHATHYYVARRLTADEVKKYIGDEIK